MNEDIEEMMYGFGDEWPPNAETTALMEDLVKDYIEDLASRVDALFLNILLLHFIFYFLFLV